MKLAISLLMVGALSIALFSDASSSVNQTIMSVINNSGSAIQISYLKNVEGPLLNKLIEPQEALTFGVVSEATISGVGIIDKYMKPQPFRFFPAEHCPASKYCIVSVNGTKNKSVTKPFGEWNISYIVHKSPEHAFPVIKIPNKDMIVDAFPTAVRMGVPTPRFILGLPNDAKIADAIEAETILTEKWSSVKALNSGEGKIIVKIIYILNKAREAFELNKPDEPLSELVPPRSLTIALAE